MLKINDFQFKSRLFLGTGKFSDFDIQKEAVVASETEVLTFTVRRMNIFEPSQPNLLEKIDTEKYTLLPNTAGADTAKEAVRHAQLARACGLCALIRMAISWWHRTRLSRPA